MTSHIIYSKTILNYLKNGTETEKINGLPEHGPTKAFSQLFTQIASNIGTGSQSHFLRSSILTHSLPFDYIKI